MSLKVKAAALVEPRRIEIDQYALPEIGEDDAILRVEQAGLCGTDYKLFTGGFPLQYPVILGHEILGRIERIGPGMAAREGLKEGDRVVVESGVPCGKCPVCDAGQYRLCFRGHNYGFSNSSKPPYLWGAFAEYMYLAQGSFINKVAEHVNAEAATVAASTLGNGIRWMRSVGNAEIGKSVLILGCGAQGLCSVIAAKESGAYPIMITGLTADAPRLALARELGADVCIDIQKEDVTDAVRQATGGRMASVVLDVTGNAESIARSIELVETFGTVVCGSHVSNNVPAMINTNDIVNREIRFQGVFTHSAENTRQAMRVAESGKYPLEKFISHRFSIDEAEKAVRSIGREIDGLNPIKVCITP